MKSSVLKKRTSGSRRNRRIAPRSRSRSRSLRIESLETRALLTATILNVNTFDDVVNLNDDNTISLREAVIRANSSPGDFEIQLQAGTYWLTIGGDHNDTAEAGDLDVLNNGSVTIVGTSAGETIINAGGDEDLGIDPLGDRVFEVHVGAALSLEGLTVTGGTATGGSFLNPNPDHGGGIRVDGGTIVLTAVMVADNSAYFLGGGIYNTGFGSVTLTDSTVSENLSGIGGGGGGIYNAGSGSVVLTDSAVVGNLGGNGGGIANAGSGSVILADSTVADNSARSGGGISNTSSGSMTLTNTIVYGNMASGAVNSAGGGIFNSSSAIVNVNESFLLENSSTRRGGGIYNSGSGSVVVTSSSLAQNTTNLSSGGGAIFNMGAGSSISVTDSTVSDSSGGGIVNEHSGSVSVANSTISDNSGGGIRNRLSGSVSVTDSTLSKNSDGGIQNDHNNSMVTITNSSLTQNTDGGIRNGSGSVILTDSTLSKNAAPQGGAVFNGTGSVTITDSTISHNTASGDFLTSHGGGITNWSGSVILTSSTLSENTAGARGGGIHNHSGSVILTDSTVSGNAAAFGGGIYNENFGIVGVTGSTVAENSANSGGGVYNTSGSQVEITNGTLSGNTGNSIFNSSPDSTVNIAHSTITNTTADADANEIGTGGGIHVAAGTVTLQHTIVGGNIAGSVTADSSYNLITSPASAGGLADGENGNIVGDGDGNLLNIHSVLDINLADNGGPTLTHALVEGSPAIDAGDPDIGPHAFDPPLLYDQRGEGFDRVSGGRIDIGAYEVQIPNQPPVADAGGPYEITVGDSLELDASESFDPDGDPLAFAWDLTGDGQFIDATAETLTLTWEELAELDIEPGTFDIAVQVHDGQEADVATTTLSVLKAAPTVAIDWEEGTYNGGIFEASGTVIGFDGSTIGTPTFTYFAGTDTSGDELTAAPVNAGTYTVLAEFAGDTLHTDASETATITIDQAPLTVDVSNAEWEIGTAFPEFQVDIAGAVDGEQFAADAWAEDADGAVVDETAQVGTYTIMADVSEVSGLLSNYAVTLNPGDLTVTPAQVEIDIRPESLNISANGAISLVILRAGSNFDLATIDLNGLRFAGAEISTFNQTLADINGDGSQDLMLHFRMDEEVKDALEEIYREMVEADLAEDGNVSAKQAATLELEGAFGDHEQQFNGSDAVDLFFSGRALRDLLDSL